MIVLRKVGVGRAASGLRVIVGQGTVEEMESAVLVVLVIIHGDGVGDCTTARAGWVVAGHGNVAVYTDKRGGRVVDVRVRWLLLCVG